MSSSSSEGDSENTEDKQSCTPEYKKRKRGESSRPVKHRIQKYRREWESDGQFKGWLIEAKGNVILQNKIFLKI